MSATPRTPSPPAQTPSAAPSAAAPKTPATQPAPASAPAANVSPRTNAGPTPANAPAAAPSGGVPKAAPVTPAARDAALQKLASSDPVEVRAAIDALRTMGGAPAQQALIARVQAGLPPLLAEQAVDALVQLKATRALPVLIEMMQHRRAELRRRALLALGALASRGTASVEKTVITALEDPALEVRTAAAQVTVRLGQRRAVPALLAAYDRGLSAAMPAVGALAAPTAIDALLARAHDGVLDALVPAFDAMLARADFARSDKVGLIRKLAKLNSPSAQRYLVALLERFRSSSDERLKQTLSEVVQNAAPPAETAAPPADAARTLAKQAGGR